MKKVFLLYVCVVWGACSFAQVAHVAQGPVITPNNNLLADLAGSILAKTTKVDSEFGINPTNLSALTYYTYYNDSGYLYGTNLLGNKGYAQRYDFNGADSSLQVRGVVAYFAGRYTAGTTKTVTFKCWTVGPRSAPIAARPHFLNSGVPDTVLAQTNAFSIKDIGINVAQPTFDTPKVYFFPSPTTPPATASFFTGFEVAYTPTALNGDTISVIVDANGNRTQAMPYRTISGGDTIYNNWNAIEAINSSWFDGAYASGGILNNYFLYPVLIAHTTIGFKGVTKNNLTWYGNYPNPAVNSTNIKFSLGASADVSVEIMDINGRKMDVINESGLSEGTHEISYNTQKLTAGNYIYLIRTSAGDGMASQFTVVR